MIKALIFDLDGTLADTNDAHARAWQLSLRGRGFEVPLQRIDEEIGKGGDHFVESVLGKEAETQHGEALRQSHTRHFLAAMKSGPTRVFSGAQEIIEHARNLGLKTALASSSQVKELEAVEASTGVAWRELLDVIVTSSDVQASKPSPDSIVVALEKLKLPAPQCLLVGDTIYDAQAAQKAGVVMLGVETGPSCMTPLQLIEAGARQTYRDVGDILAHFDDALGLAIRE